MKTLLTLIFIYLLGFILVACSGASASTLISTTEAPPSPTNTPLPATKTPLSPTDNPATESKIDLQMEIPTGDPLLGELTALNYRCFGCHVDHGQDDYYGPRFTSTGELPRIMERGDVRLSDPDYQGHAATNQEYVIESILEPEIYRAPGEWHNINPMPTDYQERMTETDLADILAWLDTFE